MHRISKFILKLLLSIFVLSAISFESKAGCGSGHNDGNYHPYTEFNKCDFSFNLKQIKFYEFNKGDDDDQMNYIRVYMWRNGSWQIIWKMERTNFTGATTYGSPREGTDYYHGTQNSHDVTASFRREDIANWWYFADLRLNYIPQDVYDYGQLKIRVEAQMLNNSCGNGNGYGELVKEFTHDLPDINAPSALTASNNVCDKVNLSWTNNSQFWETSTSGCSVSGTYFVEVIRNNVLLETLAGNVTSYADNTAIRGVNYNYTVRTGFRPKNGATTYLYSVKSTAVTGFLKPNPVAPSGFIASQDRCDGTVVLEWVWSDVNPQNGFVIERSLSNIFTNITTILVSGDKRSQTDPGLTRGVNYFYRIKSRNDCWDANNPLKPGESAASSFVIGVSPSVPSRATNIRLFPDSINNIITIRWNDNTNIENRYTVERSAIGGGISIFEANPNDTFYIDDQASSCVNYNYVIKVFSECAVNGVSSSGLYQTRLTPNLTATFDTTFNKLKASKGYFPDRIELTWNNRNKAQLDAIRIYRKVYGTNSDSILIGSVPSGSGLYLDNTGVAGILYKYTVIGEVQCAGFTRYSNFSEDIGFRSPSGLINGQITYNGGFAVDGVKVLAQSTSGSRGASLAFDGQNDYAKVVNPDAFVSTTALTVEFWNRMEKRESFLMLSKYNSLLGGFRIYYDSLSNSINFQVANNSGSRLLTLNNPFTNFNVFNQITAVLNNDSLLLYINGVYRAGMQRGSVTLGQNVEPYYMGGSPVHGMYGAGNIDEVRIWSMAKSRSLVERDFDRTIDPNDSKLSIYWTFDEKVNGLSRFFDLSNNNQVFNENHGDLINGSFLSDTIPSNNQLSLAAYTNSNGSYSITNVRYTGSGNTFTITPSLGIHGFSPSNKVVFLGDGAQVQNAIDFTDVSSFEFTGLVRFAGTTCPASGASVLIDGQPAILNSMIVLVNDSGKFNIRVPIGNHVVSLSQNKHTFSQGRFPPSGVFNFQSPVSAQFYDSTLLDVVGRVVGGNRELNKVAGLGRSKNNIGMAKFTFNSIGQSGINGCFSVQVITDSSTGEYRAKLYPLRYTINGLNLVNKNDPTLLTDPVLNNPNNIDLTSIPDLINVADTFRNATMSRVDTTSYHKRLDFKYFVKPQIFVTNTATAFDTLVNNFAGERNIKLNDSVNIDIRNNQMGYPVFVQNKYYSSIVKVVEVYTNVDLPLNSPQSFDRVPISGRMRFFNDLATADDTIREVPISDGQFNYNFRAGTPNISRNSSNPNYDYTKTLQIEFVPDLGITVNWQPLQNEPAIKFYRAYVFGARSGGASFTSTGPALVDFILRDPPGSLSSATWTKGTAYSSTESWNLSNIYGFGKTGTLHLGTKNVVSVGIGAAVQTSTEIDNNISLGVAFSKAINEEGELVTTTTSNTTISTGADRTAVGAGSDIFYGKTTNIIFGNSDEIQLIDTTTCKNLETIVGTPVCVGNSINGYRIGKQQGYYVVPGSITSTFAYTQDEILNIVIPGLEALRNQLFTRVTYNNRGQRRYTALFNNPSDPENARKFGSNNDDPIWGANRSSANPLVRDGADTMGMSYIFHGDKPQDIDSVRFYNNQIRLWKNAIARNEETKNKFLLNNNAAAVNGGQNISIGKAIYTQSFSTKVDDSYTESFEWNVNEDLSYQFGFKFNGFGISTTGTLTFEQKRGKSSSTTNTQSNSFSYTLNDGDEGDLISVNVVDPKDGTGHVFKLIAGRTSCPYEGRKTAMFYNTSNDTITSTTLYTDGPEIQAATAQNDKPKINVQQKSIYNVPASDAAIFVLELGNLSEGRQDRTYELRVDESSNPNGAIVKVDGLDPTRTFTVPYGTTLQKTLTVEKGPLYYDYNNIRLVLKSACDNEIFDTVSISARFLPSCTPLTLKSPDDRWVLNNSLKDTLPVLIGNYNYNYGGFKRIDFQFKPASGNVWYTEASFFKDTSNENVKIPIGTADIFYPFSFKNLPDGKYELRAVSECVAPGYPNTRISSTILQGLADRVNPSPFGTPSPGDGIVSPNDDIAIQFNEDIDQSSLSLSNFEVKGVLNKTSLKSNTSIYFDGNADYLEVPPGLNLQKQNFTIEFWHKRNSIGEQVLFSQGADANASFAIGFDNDDKLYFRIGSEWVKSNVAITDTTLFNFYAISYNADLQTADIIRNETVLNIGNNKLFAPYEGTGKFYIGKSSTNAPTYAKGNLYEVRIWSKARSISDVNQTKSVLLSGTESGLLANWRMDEATGTIVKDYARSRNANMVNAQWYLLPMGKSYTFNGSSDFITTPISHFGITKEMDFTMEFWFKSNNGNRVGLLSNGKADGTDNGTINKWSIETDSVGNVLVKNNGHVFKASNKNYFDGQWHHFALVMRRNSNMSSYVDGNLEASIQALSFDEFSGNKLWIGARGWNNFGPSLFDSTDRYFSGQMDEIRIWNSSRLVEQINRDKNNRLIGTESGLSLYLPFESYQLLLGFPVLNATNSDVTSNTRTFSSFGTAAFSAESPTIKLPRPTQDINFTYTVNGDKIIITPTTANEFIENVSLDVTVKNIKDMNGNVMQSPKTWIAYMDRNQVKWQEASRTFSKESGSALSFTINIVNSGGALKEFNLTNIPVWLKITPSAGVIPPNSSLELKLVVDPTMNIGKYETDIALNTDFGFADKFLVRVNVAGKAPNWNVQPSAYSKSMSIIGQLRINNVISANTEDILAAFVGNECRGIGKVTYYEQLDKYYVFMDVYGVNENENIEFRIWNSLTGKTHVDVRPTLQFVTNSKIGKISDPQIFNAMDKVAQSIALAKGWNWISFNLLMQDSANINQLFNGLKVGNGSQIKNVDELAILDQVNGWSGNLAGINAGIKLPKSYLFYAVNADTLTVKGVEANPEANPVQIKNGWNYIGFLSQRNMNTNEALSAYTPNNDDLIKGQTSFAVYDSILGWVGSLNVMKPNQGYLLQSSKTGTLVYPRSGMFGKSDEEEMPLSSKYWQIKNGVFETNMNIILTSDLCKEEQLTGNYLMGAFIGNEIRGIAKSKLVNNELVYFLTVEGNANDKITFKLLDENTGQLFSFNQTLTYAANQLTGSIAAPLILQSYVECTQVNLANTNASSSVYPVPFKDELNLSFTLPNEENISCQIYDVSGKLVYSQDLGNINKGNSVSTLKLENLSNGLYILELTSNTHTFKHKIIRN